MPVEIKELVIRATVAEPEGTAASGGSAPGGEQEREAIVRDCVDQVLAILREREEP
jgi:hypothetical protein